MGWFPTAGVQGSGIPSHPSSTAAGVALALVTAVFGFAPPGRWRRLALAGSAALCVGLAALCIATRQFTASESWRVRSTWCEPYGTRGSHRDIKPANVLVRGGRVYLIDAFFCQLRPSAWRQSVDLANMMLMLALRSESARVYKAALRRFTPEEVAEAFAATRGVTVPHQLRTMVMRDERSLAKEFAQLAPPRRRIPVQRWTVRRLALAGRWSSAFAPPWPRPC